MWSVRLLIVIGLALGFSTGGCKKKPSAKPPSDQKVSVKDLPPIVITRERALVFTYRVGRDFRTVNTVDEIPLGARNWVRVQDPTVKTPGSNLVYVADLRQADKQGWFPYRILPRSAFTRGTPVPDGKPSTSAMAVGSVVLYSRPGCGACDSARAYLTRRGVLLTEKNVQADPAAARELAAKAAQKGFSTGVVPIIDVNGEIVVGLDVRKLESLLRRKI